MSVKITCKFCGASVESATVQEAIAWNASHDEFCTGDAPTSAEQAAKSPIDGAGLIAAERQRQVSEEGWDADHDRGHAIALAAAAEAYALSAQGAMLDMRNPEKPRSWPWADRYWKPTGDPVRDLTKAGALVAAAIDALTGGDHA